MEILRDVLTGLCGDKSPKWTVKSYKNKDDFNYLWSENFLSQFEARTEHNLVVIWDGMPEPDGSGVNILDHITPVDWAITLSYRLLHISKENKSKTIPKLRILICDISQQNHASAFAVRMLPAICHGLPWLRVYRPVVSKKWFGRCFEDLIDDINNYSPANFPSLADAQTDLVSSFVNAWIGSVAETGSHHDVSNLLGPFVLSIGFDSMVQSLLKDKTSRLALFNKIYWLNMSGRGNAPPGLWIDLVQETAKIVRPNERIKLILIDDQANQGWLDIVCAAVDADRTGNGPVSNSEIKLFAKNHTVDVWASTSYCAIKERLVCFGISENQVPTVNEDQRFKFSLTGDGAEILLLDLRLFFDEAEEIKYFKWALGIAENLKFVNEVNLPGIDCDKLEGWISKTENNESTNWRKTTEYLELLTLLPRILATIDMSLPIVIFSSTGQRQVTELLKDYRNIITIFNKPGFFGYASDNPVEDTKNKFAEAMQAAIQILRARVAIQGLLKNFPAKQDVETKSQADEKPQQEKYIEIFIDESGVPEEGNNFVVAGIALVHENLEQARTLHTKMEKTQVTLSGESNYRWLRWFGDNSECSENYMPKRLGDANERKEKFLPVLKPLGDLFKTHTTDYFSFAITAKLDQLRTTGKLKGLTYHNLDGAYFELFEWLIDVVLYEFLPEKLGYQSKLKFKIYGATRMRTKDGGGEFNEVEKAVLKDNWGISTIVNEKGIGKYQSLDRMSFMPLVVNILSGRPHPKAEYMSDGASISGAVGFSLKYVNAPKRVEDSFRHAHYIADLVANFTYISLPDKNANGYAERDAFCGFFKARFVDAFDDSFKAAIDASKYLESNLLVQCFLRAVAAGRYHKDKRTETCPESIVVTILSKISAKVNALTRNEFHEFTTALSEWWRVDANCLTFPVKPLGEDSYPQIQSCGGQAEPTNETQVKIYSNSESKAIPAQYKKITLAGLSLSFANNQKLILEHVKNVLAGHLAFPIEVGFVLSATKKLKCEVNNIPEDKYDQVLNLLISHRNKENWKNCD